MILVFLIHEKPQNYAFFNKLKYTYYSKNITSKSKPELTLFYIRDSVFTINDRRFDLTGRLTRPKWNGLILLKCLLY